MRIATWNVNSLRARHDLVLDWVRRVKPDVLCMQETKVPDDDFPTDEFSRLGYSVAMCGEKSYNGVAIAARGRLRDIEIGLPSAKRADPKRMISATFEGIRVMSCYVPNGKSVDSPDFVYKLNWLEQLTAVVRERELAKGHLVIAGDFNIARDARDLYDPSAFIGTTHFHPLEHAALEALLGLGLSDAYRLHEERGERFSWWDYRGASFRRNQGMRIDYVFLSQSLAKACVAASIDREERAKDKPSDHVPVVVDLELPVG